MTEIDCDSLKYKDLILSNKRSINDLDLGELKIFIQNEKEKHSEIYKNLNICQKSFIENGIMSKMFHNKERLFSHINNKEILMDNNIKIGIHNIQIPIKFVLVMSVIISKDFNKDGLFKKCAKTEDIKSLKILISNVTKENYKEIYNKLEKYDIITCCVLYKSLFGDYSYLIFPDISISLFYKMLIEEKSVEKRIIIFRFLILGLPRENRVLLDSVIAFLNIIYLENTDNGKNMKNRLDLKGLAACIAPRIMRLDNIEDPKLLRKMVNALSDIFVYHKDLFYI
ncbi:RhoGAP domain containing protein [Spraguea lophii 42_110]|uniref:RhoGAP domain containing protein n=1 Tax=Spraguea lophii (strain 42_110) TaxID=1358809 RepID=S7W549_SPRLO|nr:RhoGAP domain containing protein [Spraguea lophii 42_110]